MPIDTPPPPPPSEPTPPPPQPPPSSEPPPLSSSEIQPPSFKPLPPSFDIQPPSSEMQPPSSVTPPSSEPPPLSSSKIHSPSSEPLPPSSSEIHPPSFEPPPLPSSEMQPSSKPPPQSSEKPPSSELPPPSSSEIQPPSFEPPPPSVEMQPPSSEPPALSSEKPQSSGPPPPPSSEIHSPSSEPPPPSSSEIQPPSSEPPPPSSESPPPSFEMQPQSSEPPPQSSEKPPSSEPPPPSSSEIQPPSSEPPPPSSEPPPPSSELQPPSSETPPPPSSSEIQPPSSEIQPPSFEPSQPPSSEPPQKTLVSSIRDKIKKFSYCFTSKDKLQSVVSQHSQSDNNNSTRIHSETTYLCNLITTDLNDMKKASTKLEDQKKQVDEQVKDASAKLEKFQKDQKVKELRKLKKTVTKLKIKVSPNYKIDVKEKDPHRNQQLDGAIGSTEEIAEEVLKKMPQLYEANTFKNSVEFQNLLASYRGLSVEQKLCLLCFSVFPEDAIIKKRLMVYWWIGEGFVPPIKRTGEGIENRKTAEEYGKEFFDKLMELGFIEPVNNKSSLIIGSCKMHPFIRSVVVTLAEKAKFFDFDLKGYPTEEFLSSYRACLSGKGLVYISELEKLHMLFNVKEANLEFKAEWLLKMSNVNVLYLGRWQASPTQHIEVEDTKFLEGLKNMKHLRFFSLQGISGITELPESISKLTCLTILDLRACHSLEVLPDGIGLLENLTHLDMSECYLLEHMPKKLAKLSKLQVLKGFIVGDTQDKYSCTLDDLEKLPVLTKLSIYTGMKSFPTNKHVIALAKLKGLLKLTIAWGGGALQGKEDNKLPTTTSDDGEEKKKKIVSIDIAKKRNVDRSMSILRTKPPMPPPPLKLPSSLEKLDLKCIPERKTAGWLKPGDLKDLKKLYIRGGKFFDLGQFQDLDDEAVKESWEVEQLRLKYLTELEMDWTKLQELFPKLIYLEKVECPKLSFFPCDESGVWSVDDKTKPK